MARQFTAPLGQLYGLGATTQFGIRMGGPNPSQIVQP
jgi:hypothetical protein